MDNQQGTNDLAYLGGIIDGEGSIYAALIKAQNSTYAKIELKIVNTNFELIEYISGIYKKYDIAHYISDHKKQKLHHKSAKTITVGGIKRLYKALPILIPFVVIKRKQAILALRYINSRLRNTSRKAPFTKDEVEILAELKELNQRGIGHLNDYTESFKGLRLEKI